MEFHCTNETTEAQKNPFQGHVRWNLREAEPGRVSDLLNKDENHVTQSFLIHSSLWLLSSNSAQKTISPKGDDLHIWIRTLHTQALTDWGPRASKVRSCGNVSVSFIALSTKQIQ